MENKLSISFWESDLAAANEKRQRVKNKNKKTVGSLTSKNQESIPLAIKWY